MYYVLCIYIYVFVRHFPPYFMTHRWILFGSGDSPKVSLIAIQALSRQWGHRRFNGFYWVLKPSYRWNIMNIPSDMSLIILTGMTGYIFI